MKDSPFNIKSTLSKETFVACHESGHALIGWYYGLTLHLVSIQPGRHLDDTECDGITKSIFPESGRVESVNHRMFTLPRVLELLAGRTATDLLCPEMPEGGYSHDFKTVENLFAPDNEILQMHKWRTEHPEAGVDEFYQTFKPIIHKIINSKRGRRAITALSRALLKARQLSGRSAVQILEKAWGKPRPLWALPADQHKSIVDEGPQTFSDAMNKVLIYMNLLKKEILPFRDSEENTSLQDETIQRIADNILSIQFLAIGPLPEETAEDQSNKPS